MKLGPRSVSLSNLNHERVSHHNGHDNRQLQWHNQCIRCNSALYSSRNNFSNDCRHDKYNQRGIEQCLRELQCLSSNSTNNHDNNDRRGIKRMHPTAGGDMTWPIGSTSQQV